MRNHIVRVSSSENFRNIFQNLNETHKLISDECKLEKLDVVLSMDKIDFVDIDIDEFNQLPWK